MPKTLIFDESGNLGTDGRYFVICCIDTDDAKPLHRIMKKKLLLARTLFPLMIADVYEVKASNAYPCVMYHILESIVTKDLQISYIVADLKHTYPKLLQNKNVLYNYLLRLLIDKIIPDSFRDQKLVLKLDNRTIRVKSQNSFTDYINIHLNAERNLNLDIEVHYVDSKSANGFIIQAADYISNAIYSFYEYRYDLYYNKIKTKIFAHDLFPREKFGL